MTYLMFDTAGVEYVAQLPAGASYAGYINGAYATYAALRARFPRSPVLAITITAAATAHVLDVENGDATPAQAPGWVRLCHADGIALPIIYAARATMEQAGGVLARLAAAQLVPGVDCLLWVAQWDGIPLVPAGYDAKQYASVEAYDTSNIVDPDRFFGAAPAPPPEEENMAIATGLNHAGDFHVFQERADGSIWYTVERAGSDDWGGGEAGRKVAGLTLFSPAPDAGAKLEEAAAYPWPINATAASSDVESEADAELEPVEPLLSAPEPAPDATQAADPSPGPASPEPARSTPPATS